MKFFRKENFLKEVVFAFLISIFAGVLSSCIVLYRIDQRHEQRLYQAINIDTFSNAKALLFNLQSVKEDNLNSNYLDLSFWNNLPSDDFFKIIEDEEGVKIFDFYLNLNFLDKHIQNYLIAETKPGKPNVDENQEIDYLEIKIRETLKLYFEVKRIVDERNYTF